MYRSRGWYKVKQSDGFMIYTYRGGLSNYSLNDFALYNKKGVVSLNCFMNNVGEDADEHLIRKELLDYFRRYGKRLVVVERFGKKDICFRAEVHFPYPQLPTVQEVADWIEIVKNTIKS